MKIILDLNEERIKIFEDMINSYDDCGSPGLKYQSEKANKLVAYIETRINESLKKLKLLKVIKDLTKDEKLYIIEYLKNQI